MPAWGGPLRTPKNWFFERFYIIKSNWKSSSLFFLLFPLASCCRTLPLDKGKKEYQYVTVTLLGLFLSTPNLLYITIFYVLVAQWYYQKQWYQKYVKATCIEYCSLAMPAWGGPLRTPKNWFFERFYIIKSNWKSSSLFFLLFPLASCCRTLPLDKGKKEYQYVTVTLLGLFLSTPNIL